MTAATKTHKNIVAPDSFSRDKNMNNVFGTPEIQPRQEPATKTYFTYLSAATKQPRQKRMYIHTFCLSRLLLRHGWVHHKGAKRRPCGVSHSSK